MKENERYGVENCPLKIFDEFTDASLWVAEKIIALVKKREPVVIGLCAGSSPSAIYNRLAYAYKNESVSYKNMTVFLLDEYYPISKNAIQSKRFELQEKLFDKIDIPENQIYSLDGSNKDYQSECQRYEDKIAEVGGFDFILFGVGGTGHIGANEPGTHFDSKTRRVPLDRVTRIAAASDFKGEEFVPSSALTMGLGTISSATEMILLAFGEGKSKLVKKIVEGEVTTKLPASIVQNHKNSTVVLDSAASSKLTRECCPWTKTVFKWSDEQTIKKAVIWLATQTKKSILKLTNRDYMDYGMGDLITLYESAYNLNIKIFSDIQNGITGWPAGRINSDSTKKRIVIFSPHPDDDVISMGGTFARLVSNGHDVHVAYQTNGNLAVADNNVQHVIDFLRSLESEFGDTVSLDNTRLDKMEKFISDRDPLVEDMPDIQFMKGLIRKVETIAACRHIGVPLENNHHLDLPFYHTGTVRKKPLSQKDIDIVKDLLQKIKPQQIFAAGDLSDPHGTHRVCLNAIFAALDQLQDEKWLKECSVWLYRGAWAEWPIDEADMAVPISPEELMQKRISIFKHASQKDGIVFPGSDSREFWQRAEARNRGTAELYNQLGFADYEAIELFVRYDGYIKKQ